ncbi:hypothetical protein M0804_000680 [Polistes exclamans]|nr:hypothetical protein M0804_000680 [Polistes exclamans]
MTVQLEAEEKEEEKRKEGKGEGKKDSAVNREGEKVRSCSLFDNIDSFACDESTASVDVLSLYSTAIKREKERQSWGPVRKGLQDEWKEHLPVPGKPLLQTPSPPPSPFFHHHHHHQHHHHHHPAPHYMLDSSVSAIY